jgi:hypothetical protein
MEFATVLEEIQNQSAMTEQEFAERWWNGRFPSANPPTGASPITFADALDLLIHFRKVSDPKRVMNVKEKHFLESWWQRRFSTADPLRWDSFMTLADAEDLLLQYRKSADVLWPPGMAGRRASHQTAQ